MFFTSYRITDLATHLCTCLVGCYDATGKRTPILRPLWLTPTPLGRLGWWGGVIRNGRLLDELVKYLSCQFLTIWEYREPLLMERRFGWGLYSYLIHLASGVDPVLGFYQISLFRVD